MEYKPIREIITITIFVFILGILILLILNISGKWLYEGDYIIDSMWLGDKDENGVKSCNNCLWIKFDEGCDHYSTYYFEEQHEFDDRLEVGTPVNIYFKKDKTIKHIEPKKEYNYKC